MKILIDMNLSPLWVQFLADSGFDSIHWSSVGPPAAPDTEIMDYANANGLVIFTHDLDFGRFSRTERLASPALSKSARKMFSQRPSAGWSFAPCTPAARTWKQAPWSPWIRTATGFGFCQYSRSDAAAQVKLYQLQCKDQERVA